MCPHCHAQHPGRGMVTFLISETIKAGWWLSLTITGLTFAVALAWMLWLAWTS